jgi:hypothetical protein
MLANRDAAICRDPRIEELAAKLTQAVYPLVLQQGTRGSWLDPQLGLWRTLVAALREWRFASERTGP